MIVGMAMRESFGVPMRLGINLGPVRLISASTTRPTSSATASTSRSG